MNKKKDKIERKFRSETVTSLVVAKKAIVQKFKQQL